MYSSIKFVYTKGIRTSQTNWKALIRHLPFHVHAKSMSTLPLPATPSLRLRRFLVLLPPWMSFALLFKNHVFIAPRFVPGEGGALEHPAGPAPSPASSPWVSWSPRAPRYFYFRVKSFLVCLKMYCKSNWAILSGNHTAASWGYGKVGKGGRHLIPLKWANKMSDPQTSREFRAT